jgi:hypothetical protein
LWCITKFLGQVWGTGSVHAYVYNLGFSSTGGVVAKRGARRRMHTCAASRGQLAMRARQRSQHQESIQIEYAPARRTPPSGAAVTPKASKALGPGKHPPGGRSRGAGGARADPRQGRPSEGGVRRRRLAPRPPPPPALAPRLGRRLPGAPPAPPARAQSGAGADLEQIHSLFLGILPGLHPREAHRNRTHHFLSVAVRVRVGVRGRRRVRVRVRVETIREMPRKRSKLSHPSSYRIG